MTHPSRFDQRVYVAQSPKGAVKIGRSWNPSARVAELRCQFRGIFLVWETGRAVARCDAVEHTAHNLLTERRITAEWFEADPHEAVAAVVRAQEMVEAGDLSLARQKWHVSDHGTFDRILERRGIKRQTWFPTVADLARPTVPT